MRAIHVAPWLGCVFGTALAIALAATPAAEAQNKRKKKPGKLVSRCVSYDQDTKDEGVYIRLESSCKTDLECNVSWELRCQSDKPKDKRHGAKVFVMMAGQTGGVLASSAACGDDGWRVSNIRWSCRSDD